MKNMLMSLNFSGIMKKLLIYFFSPSKALAIITLLLCKGADAHISRYITEALQWRRKVWKSGGPCVLTKDLLKEKVFHISAKIF